MGPVGLNCEVISWKQGRFGGNIDRFAMVNVLLVISDPYIAIQLMACLRDCRAKVILLDFTGTNSLRFSRICRGYQQALPKEIRASGPAAAKRIDALGHGADIAIAAGMEATLFLARAKPFVERVRIFPMAEEEVLTRLNNKWNFARLCYGLGLPHPSTDMITSLSNDFPAWYRGQQVIIKPLSQSGGRGVRWIESREELFDCLASLKPRGASSHIIQECVPGVDGVLGIFALNGRVVASSVHSYSQDLSSAKFCNVPSVLEIGARIVECENLTGIFEFDLRYNAGDGSWWVIECNPRFWASVGLALFAGVNFVQLGLEVSEGRVPSEGIAPTDGEWMRLKDLLRRMRRDGLRSFKGSGIIWNGLRYTWSDPLPSMLIRRDSQKHQLQ